MTALIAWRCSGRTSDSAYVWIPAALILSLGCANEDLPPPGGVQPCGGIFMQPCSPDQYCRDNEPGACGTSIASGQCRRRPTVCHAEVLEGDGGEEAPVGPVIGCDGIQYRNACEARQHGTDVTVPSGDDAGAVDTGDSDAGA